MFLCLSLDNFLVGSNTDSTVVTPGLRILQQTSDMSVLPYVRVYRFEGMMTIRTSEACFHELSIVPTLHFALLTQSIIS